MHFVDDDIFEFDERQMSLIYTIEIYHDYFFLKTFDSHESHWFVCKARIIRDYHKYDRVLSGFLNHKSHVREETQE